MKKEVKEQHHSGEQGGPRAEKMEGAGGQPRQGEQRTETRTPGSYDALDRGNAPSEQGRGAPRPQTIAKHQQGIGAQSGSHSSHGEDVQEQSVRGEPRREHARDGRHNVPADRARD